MQIEIQEGRISGSTRAPPHGRFRVDGEICENGFYVGQWSLDGHFGGVITGAIESLGRIHCGGEVNGVWEDTQGCVGEVEIFTIPRQ
jgi:hypothetical protein